MFAQFLQLVHTAKLIVCCSILYIPNHTAQISGISRKTVAERAVRLSRAATPLQSSVPNRAGFFASAAPQENVPEGQNFFAETGADLLVATRL